MVSTDPGFANERTALAWQRTALALMVGSAVLTRLTFDRLGAVALLSVGMALPLSLWVFLESRARYAHGAGMRLRPRSRGGRSSAALMLATTVVALTELAALHTSR